ncbi:MAG TPA: O-antigen polysaccharide polymerase Wzy [Candidatus Coprousia avicola]|nr:O-antigen polysaccharide polymerase Wzy [Candidatus Coprousia avicola]
MISDVLLKKKPSLAVYKVCSLYILLLQALTVACISSYSNYGVMCLVSCIQLAVLIGVMLASPCRQPFSILFLIANWIFHCGQIACIAAGQNSVLNLDFRLYGSASTIESAFRFYLYSQTLVAAGSVLLQRATTAKYPHDWIEFGLHGRKVAMALVFVGLPFWLYMNISKLAGAATDAYLGVYSLSFPAPFQAIAFFFEAGLMMLLLIVGKKRSGSLLFWSVIALKVLVMSSGGRQDSVCFLAVWCLIYFGYLRKLSLGKLVRMALVVLFLVVAIDAFGELRTDGFSFSALFDYLSNASLIGIVWDSFGEFGCALSTLVVSMAAVPSLVPYGMGSSYLAGFLSIVPTLVSRFPGLKAATLFTTMLPGTKYLGGSFLGELYFNFGWFGLVGSLLVGFVIGWCQNRLNESNNSEQGFDVWIAAVLSMFLLLFIRGYFTDAIMKIAYVLLFVWVSGSFFQRVHERRGSEMSVRI